MKKRRLYLAAALMISLAVLWAALSAQPDLPEEQEAVSTLELSAGVLESSLGLPAQSLLGVTVTQMPDARVGRLYCEGVEVELYDYLDRQSLEWLVYQPLEADSTAWLGLLPDAPDAQYTVLPLSIDAPESLTVSADLLAWQQANAGYWAHVSALRHPLHV